MTKGTMIAPDALLRFIEDAGRVGVRSVAFIGDGEPTLNPALYDAIVLAKKSGVDTGMATNGLLLDMDRAHDVLRDQTYVRFNLSSATPDNFPKVHQSHANNFQPLIEKIAALAKMKREHGYDCTIGIQMVLIPENFDQIVLMAQMGADLGIDYLQIKQCSDTEYKEIGVDYSLYANAVEDLKRAEAFSTDDYAVVAKWNKLNINNETDIYVGGFRKYDICYGTPFLGQISGNGKVYPCGPYFGKDRFLMGDIHTQSYFDIVNSDRYWQVHKDIVDNVDVHCDCTIGCRQDYINKFLWDIQNPPQHVNFI
jgi:MoaA/NifB/PqqE/SkfB family radical SAM enzyme